MIGKRGQQNGQGVLVLIIIALIAALWMCQNNIKITEIMQNTNVQILSIAGLILLLIWSKGQKG